MTDGPRDDARTTASALRRGWRRLTGELAIGLSILAIAPLANLFALLTSLLRITQFGYEAWITTTIDILARIAEISWVVGLALVLLQLALATLGIRYGTKVPRQADVAEADRERATGYHERAERALAFLIGFPLMVGGTQFMLAFFGSRQAQDSAEVIATIGMMIAGWLFTVALFILDRLTRSLRELPVRRPILPSLLALLVLADGIAKIGRGTIPELAVIIAGGLVYATASAILLRIVIRLWSPKPATTPAA